MKRNGFTLIELLAVIVILAVILAIAIPNITGIVNATTRNAFESDLGIILKSIDYKILEDNSFDPTLVNENTIDVLLDVGKTNYETLTVKEVSDDIYVTIIGKSKWDNLTASGTKTDSIVTDTVAYSFVRGTNAPVLAPGMIPIKWDNATGAWVNTTESDTDWYNYTTTDKKWANAKTADGSFWVWIPRYVYKIPASNWHTSNVGTIDVQFTKGINDNWNNAVIGNIDTKQTAESSKDKWTNHLAFTFGAIELPGIWVAKYEASSSNPAAVDGGGDVINLKVKSIPNVVSWRGITINNVFDVIRSMETDSTYGWGNSGNGIDTHMMKNTEWGAIAYLSKSTYGKSDEVWVNNSNTFTTGCAGTSASAAISTTGCEYQYSTPHGLQASTTGNIYGVYDMSGGAWEYTSSYINNNHTNLTNNGNSSYTSNNKYKTVYASASIDNEPNNYVLTISSKSDAIYETSSSSTGRTSWYGDHSYMPRTDNPWLKRGGYNYDSSAGMFNFYRTTGHAVSYNGFRPVLSVNAGL